MTNEDSTPATSPAGGGTSAAGRAAGKDADAQERVLSTLNKDGTRRWLHPKLATGRFWFRRRVVAYALIVLFAALPWITVGGKPAVLLDLPAREFTFFGTTFLPTDTLLLMLFMGAVFVTIFLLTALLGRVWCGWACPQTVYMEYVYRPIERLFERGQRPAGPPRGARRAAMYATYLVVSLAVAHVFLAYFIGVEALFDWMRQSPFEHPRAFLIMAAVTGAMMFDFSFFREQTCIVACPYGRFQSVMLDRYSLIVTYDEQRGEPRGRMRKGGPPRRADLALPQAGCGGACAARHAGNAAATTAPSTPDVRAMARSATDVAAVAASGTAPLGDCIECGLCQKVCPTGIDIRDGLQMECIGCAQCIDACDEVMTKIGRPKGLIRYSSEDAVETGRTRIFRPRVVLYPALLAIFVGLFVTVLVTRSPADVTLLRATNRPYVTLASGTIRNEFRVKIVNRTDEPRRYRLGVAGLEGAAIASGDDEVEIDPGATLELDAAIDAPPGAFSMGRAGIDIVIADDAGFTETQRLRLQGPWNSGRSARDDDAAPTADAPGNAPEPSASESSSEGDAP